MVLLDAARAKDYFAARAVKLDITGNIKGIWVQPAWDSGIQPNPAPGRMGRIRVALLRMMISLLSSNRCKRFSRI